MNTSYFAHETAVIDDGCVIGNGSKIWHFSHLMTGCQLGEKCNIGQNVVVSPDVILGNNVKVQNNVSLYTGVVCEDDIFLGPSMVFTNIVNPRSAIIRREEYVSLELRSARIDQWVANTPRRVLSPAEHRSELLRFGRCCCYVRIDAERFAVCNRTVPSTEGESRRRSLRRSLDNCSPPK